MDIKLPNGKIGRFPDEMPHEEIEKVLQSQFPMESSIPSINFPQHQKGLFENLRQGLTQGYPHAVKGDINAIAQLMGKKLFNNEELNQDVSLSERIGRGIGEAGGHLSVALPAIFGGEAIAPGLLGASLGAGVSGALTTSGDWKKRLSEGLLESAIPSVFKGAGAALKLGSSAFKRSPTARTAADIIQKSHAEKHANAVAPLNQAKKLAYEENLGPIRIKSSILDEVPKILGKDEATTRLLQKARSGDYEALDQLQSDLKNESRKLAGATTHADRLLGKDAHSLGDKILNGIKETADYRGKREIADLITEGKGLYRKLADTYLNDKTIAKLVGKEKKVPKNLLNKLNEDSAEMNKFRNEHPYIAKLLKTKEEKIKLNKTIKTGKNLLTAGGVSKYLLSGDHDNEKF